MRGVKQSIGFYDTFRFCIILAFCRSGSGVRDKVVAEGMRKISELLPIKTDV